MIFEPEALAEYARGAADRLGPDTHCSIVLRSGERVAYAGSSDPRAEGCDEVEVRAGEGPCITALQHLSGILVPDLHAEEQWPAWREAALRVGFRSAAALPAYVDEATRLALNLYSDDLDPWDEDRLVGMDGYVQEIAEAVRTGLGT